MKKIAWLLAFLLLLQGILVPVRAEMQENAEPQETEVPASGAAGASSPEEAAGEGAGTAPETDPIAYVFASDPETAGEPRRNRPETPETEHVKIFRYTENIVLRGMFQRSGYFFMIPKYWDTGYVLAQVEYTVSPLIRDVPASLTFFINDHPVYSCGVSYENGAAQIVYVSVPVEYLREGYNEFTVTGYVRIYDDEGCLDDFSGANWISIAESSCLEVGYGLVDFGRRISYYPYPLISSMDDIGEDLTVYVPENPLEEELRAAFLLRADLGNETGAEDRIGLALWKGDRRTQNAVIVARQDRLPQEFRDQLAGDPDLGREGALIRLLGENGAWTLAVTAANEKDLTEGAYLLMDEERVTQEKSDRAFVAAGSSDQVVASRSLNALIEDGETIRGITGQTGLNFVGPFRQETTVYLPFSGGFVLGEGGKVDLKIRYSDNLDFTRSMITVYWGDTPVASRKLEREKASLDTFSFMMPSDVVGTHASGLRIAFDLEIEDLYCTKRADQMPWAYVSGESTLFFPAGNASTYDLSLRPYPFQRMGLFNNTAVVVPDTMDENEIAVFGRIAALTGASVLPYGSLTVRRASGFAPETENAHVIALGTWKDNSLLQTLNDQLAFRFTEEGARFAGNEQLLLSESYARQIAVLQFMRSPWQKGRAILAVCAPDSETLTQIDRFAAVQENTWALAGDAFLVDRDLETRSFRFLKEEAVEKATLLEKLEENRDAVLMTIISTSVMFLMLIAVILILLRYRKNHREEENQ